MTSTWQPVTQGAPPPPPFEQIEPSPELVRWAAHMEAKRLREQQGKGNWTVVLDLAGEAS